MVSHRDQATGKSRRPPSDRWKRVADRERAWEVMVHLRASSEGDAYDDLYEFLDGGKNDKPIPLEEPWQDLAITHAVRPFVRLPLLWASRFFARRLHVIGRERIPREGRVIFAPNHGSHIDTLYLYYAFPAWAKYSIGAGAARDVCFRGVPMTLAVRLMYNALAVQRRGGARSASMVEQLSRWLLSRPRRSLLLYPEGGRGFQDGRLGPLKKGVSRIALVTGAKLVPAVVRNANLVLPKGSKRVHVSKVPIEVEFLEPIDPTDYAGADEYLAVLQLTLALRRRLEAALGLDPADEGAAAGAPEQRSGDRARGHKGAGAG